MNEFLTRWSPRALSVFRIIVGFLFLWHGSQKLFSYPPFPPGTPAMPEGFRIVAGTLEFGGGILILLGLFTSPVAFILCGMMAIAYFTAHAPQGFLPLLGGGNNGEPAVFYCFAFLYLVFAGGGEWSLDRLIRRKE